MAESKRKRRPSILRRLFSLFSSDKRTSTDIHSTAMKTSELSPDSDGDLLNSSQSQSSVSSCDRSSSFSRLSFDTTAAAAAAPDTSSSLPACRPHRSSDPAWDPIRSRRAGGLGPRDFELVRRIGSGDVGTVYLCRLRGPAAATAADRCLYAMKVVDKQAAAAKKKKLERAETEKRILRLLDHPFLPTLYADFDAPPRYSCVVMEYCGGGDLHSLRHRQPGRRFSAAAARFYAAEVLVALEYLHMLGIVYRDLKPENVLIRTDGHIMLSDFDLSLESTASPSVEHFDDDDNGGVVDVSTAHAACCLPRRVAGGCNRRFVAEPVEARSSSFVGTHDYVAPEVAAGKPHGSAVDWWAFGVFLHELLYGRTPFAGSTNEATLRNIVRRPLALPPPAAAAAALESAARDLIAGLLAKDPAARLGSRRGAAEVRAHPFFNGLNLALMRSRRPPVVPAAASGRAKPAPVEFF